MTAARLALDATLTRLRAEAARLGGALLELDTDTHRAPDGLVRAYTDALLTGPARAHTGRPDGRGVRAANMAAAEPEEA